MAPLQELNIIAVSYGEIGDVFFEKKDFEEAFTSYARIVKKPEGDEQDFRTDPIAPYAMYRAIWALYELGRKDELETFATTYINALRDNKPILSAEAQFRFAKILREKLEDYEVAATEYAKLQSYPAIPNLMLDLIKLKGKYYEGFCYNKLSRPKDADKVYQEAIRLFNTMFQPLIDIPNIKSPNISKEEFDYCIQTALEYAEKVCDKIKNTEYGKKACDEIKEARRKLEDKDKTMQKSDASNNSNSSEAAQTNKQLTPEQIAQKASSSTVFITVEGIREYEDGQIIDGGAINEKGEIVEAPLGTGSGFFIKPNLIATNYHVISPERKTHNKNDDKNEIISLHPLRGTARLVGTDREYAIIGYTAIDPDRDLAILKVRAFGVKLLFRSDSEEVNQGEAVYPIGNPLGLANVVSEGQISSVQWVKSIGEFINNKSKLVRDFRRDDTPHKLFMMTAPISPGSSGGPVLNSKGRVIGVSVGYRGGGQNLNYAVPVNYLKNLLNLIGPPKPLSDLEVVY